MSVQDEVPKSRTTITYRTEIDGEEKAVDLPYRLLVMGDFSGGTSKDRQVDLDERAMRSFDGANTNELIKDMGIELDMVVPNKINAGEESMRVNIPIKGMSSFSPDEIAKTVPQIRSLVLFKKLLEEMQSNVANKKEFAQLLNKLYQSQESMSALKEKLKSYEGYKIEIQSPEQVKEEENE